MTPEEALKAYEVLDPKIENLIRGLRRLGFNTVASCQGHPDKPWRFPQVNIRYQYNNACPEILRLKTYVDKFKDRYKINGWNNQFWFRFGNDGLFCVMVYSIIGLEDAQKVADDLGLYLQKCKKLK